MEIPSYASSGSSQCPECKNFSPTLQVTYVMESAEGEEKKVCYECSLKKNHGKVTKKFAPQTTSVSNESKVNRSGYQKRPTEAKRDVESRKFNTSEPSQSWVPICGQCASEIPEGVNFCGNCGAHCRRGPLKHVCVSGFISFVGLLFLFDGYWWGLLLMAFFGWVFWRLIQKRWYPRGFNAGWWS